METTKKFDKKVLTVEISGHVDATTAPELEKLVQEEVAKAESIIFDFAKVEYISSAGLRVLLSTHKAMTGKGGEFVIQNVTGDVRNILDMTGFSGFLTIK